MGLGGLRLVGTRLPHRNAALGFRWSRAPKAETLPGQAVWPSERSTGQEVNALGSRVSEGKGTALRQRTWHQEPQGSPSERLTNATPVQVKEGLMGKRGDESIRAGGGTLFRTWHMKEVL